MSNTFKKIFLTTFLATQFVLYIHILFLNIFVQNVVCYSSIVMCFMFSLTLLSKKTDNILLVGGLLYTVTADTFLVLLNATHLEIAMVSFCIVQLLYLSRILITNDKKNNFINILTRIVIFIGFIIVAFFVDAQSLTFLIVISLFYFANLFCNVLFSFFSKNRNILFAVGLLLFLLCDIFVGLPFLIEFLKLSNTSFLYQLNNINFNMIWLFYLPSQVLIALSCKKTRHK